MTWQPDIFIYHSPCDDGFAAAWAVWKRWGDAVEFFPTNYGEQPPEVLGKHVLIGDFSYKREGIDACLQGAASVVILDHHKTAQAELQPFAISMDGLASLTASMVPGMLRDLAEMGRPPCLALFDMNRSGARLTWDFCHPDVPAPWLIRLVEDRDLWHFNYDQTEAFSTYLRSFPYDFDKWDLIAADLEDHDEHACLMQEARGIRRYFERQVDKIASTATPMLIDNLLVPAANSPREFSSEVAHKLLEMHPYAPFAATYNYGPGGIGFSLRSEDGRADVSEIAQRYGGGGHRNAAGFVTPKP